MTIKFLDLKKQIKGIEKKILDSFKKNIKNTSYIGGGDLLNFEKNFSRYLNVKYCLGVANGTDALEIAIKSLNLKKNSEIIVPANTWISTAEAVINNNLALKFVDVDETHNICVKDLKKKVSKKTSAIIVVHLYGNSAKLNEIKKVISKYAMKVIEDCAQSHGSELNGKKTSSFGDISTFSFFPSKNLGCLGDGGCIVTNKKNLFLNAKKIANHGGLKKNNHFIIGRNSRLDNIQAGILNIKLKYLNKWIDLREKQSILYKRYLNGVGDIKFVKQTENSKNSHHLFVIKTNKRDALKKYLLKKKIYTGIHYPLSLPQLPVFKKKHFSYCKKMNAVKWSKRIMSLPIGEHLDEFDIKKVCLSIKSFFNV
jgi:dTDP-4-amino-4,6-dideoxygalactose transaminase